MYHVPEKAAIPASIAIGMRLLVVDFILLISLFDHPRDCGIVRVYGVPISDAL
jgi:hypothetical protein